MIVAGHQPNYLPYLGFFHKLASVDRFMIVDTAQFVKRGAFGWMHRNKLRTHDGWQWLSLPVKTAGRREQTCAEAELQNQLDWRRKHWASIEVNYRRAGHFATYRDAFHEVYQHEWTHLTALNVELIRRAARALEIPTPIDVASECGVGGEAHGLLANICRHYGAARYLSGVHGRDYLDLADMARRGVQVEFQAFAHPTYGQCFGGPFVPYMCVLDLLFNEGPRAREILMAGGGAVGSVAHEEADAS